MKDSEPPPAKHIAEFLSGATRPREKKSVYAASAFPDDGSVAELIYDPVHYRTAFCVFDGAEWREQNSIVSRGERLVPFSPHNNLLKNKIVLFPSEPEEYESEEALIAHIQNFIHRYLDVSPLFERIACYYVLFSWIYDSFNELPYLRARGDYGSGKTRFLLAIGSLCYKPIFASGASSASPIFRILDAFGGTLIIDESDFRFSDEKAEIVKILNNGNVKGFAVLRSETNRHGEFNPYAYSVFGPKIVGARGNFQDQALESRFLTEDMGHRRLREGIPINLPEEFATEARHLRNMLLLFRFRNYRRERKLGELVDQSIEPRLNQIFAPLLSVVSNEECRRELRELARTSNNELIAARGLDTEAQLLEIIRTILNAESRLSVGEITCQFTKRFGDEYDRKITPRWIGYLIRDRLHVKTRKSNGIHVIPPEESPKIKRLMERFGIEQEIGTNAGHETARNEVLFPSAGGRGLEGC